MEIDVDFEDASSSDEALLEGSNEAYEALLEEKAHLDLQYDQLRQRLRSLQEENERMNQRLASAHTHMQTAQGQLNAHSASSVQSKIEDKETRIRLLKGQ